MNVHELQNFDFDAPSRVQTASSYLTSSVRSSFDKDYLQSHRCDVSIRDEASLEAGTHRDDDVGANDLLDKYMILGNPNSAALPTNLKSKLASRDPSRTRWINVVGWSEALMDQLARLYLDDHGCLDLPEVSEQVLGGPIKRKDSGDFVWIQSTIWFRGGRNPSWSSLQQSGFRMVICMPTPTQAGTLITNFVGRAALANEISRICTENLLDAHAMGTHALGCVWILAFSLLKSIAEQMDFAFEIFDPTAATHSGMPRMDELPYMLQQANNLAKMDRYISALDEFSSFFVSVRSFQQRTRGVVLLETSSEPASRETDRRHNIAERATLESCLAQQRIVRARKLCSTYMRQYESLVQMVRLEVQLADCFEC